MRPIFKFLISFAIFVAVCAAGLGWYIEYEVEEGLERAVAETEGLRLRYADCSVDIFDRTVVLTGVEATLPSGHHFTADEIRIQSFDQLNPLPYYTNATSSGLTIPVTSANFGAWAPPMLKMGIAEVRGKAAVDYAYSPDTATLTVRELSLDDANLGRASLSGQVDQFDLINPRLEQLIGMRIKEATLHFVNAGLMDRLVHDWAARMKASEEETVNRIATELSGLAQFADSQENGPAKNVMLGLQRFVVKPETMTVTAAPVDPVPVLYFFMGRDLMENLQLLDMRINANQDN
ncbi:MAG: hypothetical protein H0S80_11750 [Desulfovibrionaceae bacterium]|nr:hypothetical protein [Desulfovibrionaceae bacterium]